LYLRVACSFLRVVVNGCSQLTDAVWNDVGEDGRELVARDQILYVDLNLVKHEKFILAERLPRPIELRDLLK